MRAREQGGGGGEGVSARGVPIRRKGRGPKGANL